MSTAGAPLAEEDGSDFGQYGHHVGADHQNPYKPFAHRMDWEIARWAKLNGLTASAVNKLLRIEGVSVILKDSHENIYLPWYCRFMRL